MNTFELLIVLSLISLIGYGCEQDNESDTGNTLQKTQYEIVVKSSELENVYNHLDDPLSLSYMTFSQLLKDKGCEKYFSSFPIAAEEFLDSIPHTGVQRFAVKLENNQLSCFIFRYDTEKDSFAVSQNYLVPVSSNDTTGYYVHNIGSRCGEKIEDTPNSRNKDKYEMFKRPNELCFVSFTMDEMRKLTNNFSYVSFEGGTKISVMDYIEKPKPTIRLVSHDPETSGNFKFDAAAYETYSTGSPCPPDWTGI